MFNLLSERMQADAEEIIILPESGLALACFKRRAQVSDPKLGTPIIKSSSVLLLILGYWRFFNKREIYWSGHWRRMQMHAQPILRTFHVRVWFLFTASIASACSAQRLSILRPIGKKAASHPTIAARNSPIHSPQSYVVSRLVLSLLPCPCYC